MNLDVKQHVIISEAGKRPHNEDFVYHPTMLEPGFPIVNNLFIVCDGIGGLGKGDVAAKLVAKNFAQYVYENPPVGRFSQSYINTGLKFVENAFDDYIKLSPQTWGMGATFILLYIDKDGAHIAWAGNCRAYHLRGANRLYRSQDHTEAAQLLAEGKISESEATTHHRRFPLRSVQSSYPTHVDYHFIPAAEIREADLFFLCTDGLLEGLREHDLVAILSKGTDAVALNQEIRDICRINAGDNFASCLVDIGRVTAAVSSPAEDASLIPAVELDPTLPEEKTPTLVRPVVETPVQVPPVTIPQPQTITSSGTPKNMSSAGGYVAPPSPPQTESSLAVPLAILAFTALIIGIVGLIWYTSGSKSKSYSDYIALAEKSKTAQQYDKAILYLDSAMRITGDDQMKIRETNLKKNDLMDVKRKLDKDKMILEADKFVAFGRLPDYLQAMRRYKEAIQNYGDNGGVIQQKIDGLNAKMKGLKADNAYNDMVSEITLLCQQGKALDAEVFIAETRKLPISTDKLKQLTDLSKNCNALAGTAPATSTNAVADNSQNREIAEAASTAPTTASQTSKSAAAEAVREVASAKPTTATAPNARKSNSSPEVVDKQKQSKKANCMTASSPLEKGKCLFEQKDYAKSREFLEAAKSVNAIDGEAAYLLGYMYHAGLGGAKNQASAIQNAKLSAKKEWTSGFVLYAKMLLANNPTSNDKLIAKGYLAQAAQAGHKEAQSLLKGL